LVKATTDNGHGKQVMTTSVSKVYGQ